MNSLNSLILLSLQSGTKIYHCYLLHTTPKTLWLEPQHWFCWWICSLGRAWQEHVVFAPLDISWNGEKPRGLSHLKDTLFTCLVVEADSWLGPQLRLRLEQLHVIALLPLSVVVSRKDECPKERAGQILPPFVTYLRSHVESLLL